MHFPNRVDPFTHDAWIPERHKEEHAIQLQLNAPMHGHRTAKVEGVGVIVGLKQICGAQNPEVTRSNQNPQVTCANIIHFLYTLIKVNNPWLGEMYSFK